MSETRKNLLQAFGALYATRRLATITVKEVAARAGYNRGTFYEYFTGLDDCLCALEQTCLDRFAQLPPLLGSEGPAPEFVEHIRELYNHRDLYRTLLSGDRRDAFRFRLTERIKAQAASDPRLPRDALVRDLDLEYRVKGLLGVLESWLSRAELPTEALLPAVRAVLAPRPPG